MADNFATNRINQILRSKIIAAGGTPLVTDLYRSDAFPILFNQLLGLTGIVAFDLLTVGTTVANTAAETVLPTLQTLTLPASALVAGSRLSLKAGGVLATTGTPTFLFRSRLNGIAGTIFGVSSALAAANNSTAAAWHHESGLVVQTGGAAGVIQPDNSRTILANAASGAAAGLLSLGNNGVAAVGAVDLSVALSPVVTATMSAADPANTVALRYLTIEVRAPGA